MGPNPEYPVDLITFTEKILKGNLHISCIVYIYAKNDLSKANKETFKRFVGIWGIWYFTVSIS